MKLTANNHITCYYEYGEYDIDGENVISSLLQTINLNNQLKSPTTMGVIPVNYNLKETDFNLGDFEKLPAIYKIKCKTKLGPKNKGQFLVPDEITFGKEIKFDKRQDGAILILGANYTKTATIRGTKIFYIDPDTNGKENNNVESRGNPIIEQWLDKQSLDLFKELPGWYNCEFSSVRSGSKGEEKIKIENLTFIAKYDINALINSVLQPGQPGQ